MIIRNKIILLLGRPGEGKTFTAAFLASFYPRIFSNVDITENGKSIINYVRNLDDVEKIQFSEQKGVVLLDEWGININARNSNSKENKEFGQLAMLGRKKNVDIIVCAQLGRMIDVYFRELANYVFEMHAWFEHRDYLMFETKIYGPGGAIVKVARLDLFLWSKMTGIEYNTLDTSKMDFSKQIKERKDERMEMIKTIIHDTQAQWTTDSSPSLTLTETWG